MPARGRQRVLVLEAPRAQLPHAGFDPRFALRARLESATRCAGRDGLAGSTTTMGFQRLNRRVHYWASAIVALPLLCIVATGLLLQLKKHWSWVQPTEARGSGTEPAIGLHDILAAVMRRSDLAVRGWQDVSRVDLRPSRGLAKVSLASNWEVQVDLGTAEVLQVAYRRSDWIESLHDGSVFGTGVKLGVFLPVGIGLLLLWVSGVWMFAYPFFVRRRVRRARARHAHE
jgi:uncharacterized iron-regulated membrane protein